MAIGINAVFYNTDGDYNTAIGAFALNQNCRNVVSGCTANYNTAIGYQAGGDASFSNGNVTGSNNTYIGAGSGPGSSSALNNATAIGANALVSASNALVLGANGVNVGIGTSTPVKPLHVASGDVYASQAGSGLIVKSPDGNTCKRIGIDNSGAILLSDVTCP